MAEWFALYWTGDEGDLAQVAARLRKRLRCAVEVNEATAYLFCDLAQTSETQIRAHLLPKLRPIGRIEGSDLARLLGKSSPAHPTLEHGQAVQLTAPPFERVQGRVVATFGESVLIQVKTSALFRLLMQPAATVQPSDDSTIAAIDYRLLCLGRRLDSPMRPAPASKLPRAEPQAQQLPLLR